MLRKNHWVEAPHWGRRLRASALNSNKRGPLDRQLQSLHFWNSVRNSKRTGRRCTSMTLGKWHTIGAPLIYLHIRWEFDTSCSFTITTNFLNASLATVKEWSLFQADVTSQCMWYIAYCTTYCIPYCTSPPPGVDPKKKMLKIKFECLVMFPEETQAPQYFGFWISPCSSKVTGWQRIWGLKGCPTHIQN